MSRVFSLTDKAFRPDMLGLARITRDLYSADSPEITEGAKVLRKHIAKQLATKGGARIVYNIKTRKPRGIGGTPSSPGSAPHRQTGRLMKSVIQGKVDTGRRIGVMWFTGPILEHGVDTATSPRFAKRGKTTVKKTTNLRRRLVIKPRPFVMAGVKSAEPELVGVIVKVGGDHLEQAVNQVVFGARRT